MNETKENQFAFSVEQAAAKLVLPEDGAFNFLISGLKPIDEQSIIKNIMDGGINLYESARLASLRGETITPEANEISRGAKQYARGRLFDLPQFRRHLLCLAAIHHEVLKYLDINDEELRVALYKFATEAIFAREDVIHTKISTNHVESSSGSNLLMELTIRELQNSIFVLNTFRDQLIELASTDNNMRRRR